MFVNNIKGRTIRIVRIRPEGYYTTTSGERRYLVAPGDYEILCDEESFRLPCEEKKAPEKLPQKKPSNKIKKPPVKQPVPPEEKTSEAPPIEPVVHEPIMETKAPQQKSFTIINNYFVPPSDPFFSPWDYYGRHGRRSFYAVPMMPPRPIIVRRPFHRHF
jgi:hypothetical protein